MLKPSGYDETQAGGFVPVNLGGHTAVIKRVVESKASNGKDMVVVLIDFDGSDAQAGYFTDQFNNDTRADKKWAFNGTKYVMVMDYNDPNKTSRAFKTFCTCVEESNNMTITWGGSDWGRQFVGKKVGVVYGEEEHEYDGKVSMRRIIKYFCQHSKAKDQKIPAPKFLSAAQANATAPAKAASDGFIQIPDGVDDEIPF